MYVSYLLTPTVDTGPREYFSGARELPLDILRVQMQPGLHITVLKRRENLLHDCHVFLFVQQAFLLSGYRRKCVSSAA